MDGPDPVLELNREIVAKEAIQHLERRASFIYSFERELCYSSRNNLE